MDGYERLSSRFGVRAVLFVPGGQSAYRPRTVGVEAAELVFVCSSLVLERLSFYPIFQPSSVTRDLADGPPGVHGQSAWSVLVADGLRCLHGRSIIKGVVVEVRGLFSDSPPQPRGQSA
jgi:hypothetical protein